MHKAQICSGDNLRRHFGSTTNKIKIPSTALRNPVPSSAQLMATDWREMTVPPARYCLCDKRPCHHFWKSSGCRNGTECDFCHEEHGQRSQNRPSKTERGRLKKIVNDMHTKRASLETLAALAKHRGYLGRLLHQHLAPAENQNSGTHPLALPRATEDATASCREKNDRKEHQEMLREIGRILQWPGTPMQSPAGSDDEGSMTSSQKAYEDSLRECVAHGMRLHEVPPS